MSLKHVSVTETKELIETNEVTILDIRDPGSYAKGHLDKAIHIEDFNVEEFVSNGDKDTALLIYCYHGHSSQSAGDFFSDHGFKNVYSLDGGYSAWSTE